MSDDPRKGKPSASGFGSDVACPGRRNLIAAITSTTRPDETPDLDAIRGQKIHRAWQTDNTLDLAEDEMVDYTSGLKHIDSVIAQWRTDFSLVKVSEMEREERLWLYNNNMDCIGSGQLDRWYMGFDEAGVVYILVIDGKSGFGTYVPASHRSWQLRYYAVLVWKETSCPRIRVAYVKPKMKAEPTDWTDYDDHSLTQSYISIVHHTWETTLPEAHRNPGIHCRYCPAMRAARCPEAAAWNMLPSVIAGENQVAVISDAITKEEAVAMVATLALPDCVKVWRGEAVRHFIEDAIKARLKGLTDAELSQLGLKRGKPKELKKIINVKAAFDKLVNEIKIDPEKVFMAMSFSNEELSDVIRRELGTSKNGTPEFIKQNLGDYIETTQSQAALKQI